MNYFQILSLIILAAFFSCYFLKAFLQKRKGIKTNHMGENKTGFVKFVEVGLKTFTSLLPLLDTLFILLNRTYFNNVIRTLGIVFSTVGTLVFIVSIITMKDSWRAGISINESTKLVTTGIYKYSRNPAFVGFDLLFIGVLITFFSWPLYIFTLITIVFFHLQIVNVEEDFLIATFKDEYVEYMKHTPRYFGIRK